MVREDCAEAQRRDFPDPGGMVAAGTDDEASIDVESTLVDQMVVHAAYDYVTPYIGNVSFLIHFDKTVELGGQ